MANKGRKLAATTVIVAACWAQGYGEPKGAAFGQTMSAVPDLRPGWTPTNRLFDQSGSITQNLTKRVRSELEFQFAAFRRQFGSASTHGLSEGDVPPLTYCPGARDTDYLSFPPPEYDEFDLHVLLSEVAVYARIVDVVPGFSSMVEPTALLVLADVTPLRSNVPSPGFALVPLGRLVVRDRVVCSPISGYVDADLVPEKGMEVVLISNWTGDGVSLGHLGLAVLGANRTLSWVYGPTGPPTMDELKDRMNDFETQGIFSITRDFARWDPANEEKRSLFIAEWSRLRESGCMDDRPVEQTSDGQISTSACPIEQ